MVIIIDQPDTGASVSLHYATKGAARSMATQRS
jgi:hypothetical protein